MKQVFQVIYHPTRGDCQRASVASLFELELEQVPHFVLFPKDRERFVVGGFYWAMGYDWVKCGKPGIDSLIESQSVGGFFEASVLNQSPVKSHGAHSVVIDLNGVVVHDPDKNEAWKGINVLKTGQLQWWTILEKRS